MQMEVLNFKLPAEWVKTSWVGSKARTTWEPRIKAISNFITDIEEISVLEGMRNAYRPVVSPKQFMTIAQKALKNGLITVPIAQIGNHTGYSASNKPVKENAPWDYTVLIFNAFNIKPNEIDLTDDNTIGKLLGYPDCCIDFYNRIWSLEGYCDTTWPMAINTPNVDSLMAEIKPSLYCNILMRWIGVRAVPHLPCSFDCDETMLFGKQFMDLGKQHGYKDEVEWTEEMLSWSLEWSALHGIAEIKTPIFKVSTNTDVTTTKYTVRLKGENYPTEGAKGLVFPYKYNTKNVSTLR